MMIAVFAFATAWIAPDLNSDLVQLARKSVEAEVLHRPIPKPVTRTEVRPVFVTIEKYGKVLGCRGDISCRTTSLEDEVIQAARGAAAHDPRYRPLTQGDLKDFLVTVTIVSRKESISRVDSLEPSDGLVLVSGDKKGIVLPWEGRDPQIRLKWAYKKAGVADGAPASLFRLIASRSRG